jgi:hypothetical protein
MKLYLDPLDQSRCTETAEINFEDILAVDPWINENNGEPGYILWLENQESTVSVVAALCKANAIFNLICEEGGNHITIDGYRLCEEKGRF